MHASFRVQHRIDVGDVIGVGVGVGAGVGVGVNPRARVTGNDSKKLPLGRGRLNACGWESKYDAQWPWKATGGRKGASKRWPPGDATNRLTRNPRSVG